MRYSRARIAAFGYELPPCVVTSEELEDRLAPVYRRLRIAPGQLAHITGIVERRYWEPGYPMAQGATVAALRALERAGIPSTEIGALVYGAVCRDDFEPATACHVAAALERAGRPIAEQALVHDLGNACLGIVSGMIEIADRIELGRIRAGIAVGCESARDIVDEAIDRLGAEPGMERFKASLATLTGGSGAAAVLLVDASAFPGRPERRLRAAVSRAEPRHHLLCRWGLEPIGGPGGRQFRQFAGTDSAAVLEHGVALGERTWADFLPTTGWSVADIDRVICHQVGAGHRDVMLPRLGLSPERDFSTFEYLGNTGTTALPIAAALAEERDFLRPGHRVGLLGIGSGLSCAMIGVDW